MKKNHLLFIASICLLVGGCVSTPGEKVNWNLPAGFEFGNTKETVHVTIHPISMHSGDADKESAALMRREFSSIVLAKLIRSKRFKIMAHNGRHEHQSDIIITPVFRFGASRARDVMMHNAVLTMAAKIKDYKTGEYIDASAPFRAVSHPRINRNAKTRIVFGRMEPLPHEMRMNLITSCFESAYKMLEKSLNELYPVSARIRTSAKVVGQKVSFAVAKGTDHGIEADDEALICYVDNDGRITVAALAAGHIGRYNSTLDVIYWNPFDEESEQIRNNVIAGKKLKLYAVFRKKDR